MKHKAVPGPPSPKEMEKYAIDDLVRHAVAGHPEVKRIESRLRREIEKAVRQAKQVVKKPQRKKG